MSYLDTVYKQFEQAGLLVDKSKFEIGKLSRCRVDGDSSGKESGWYVVHELRLDSGDVVAVGRFGNWKIHDKDGVAIELDLPELTEEEKRRFAEEQQRIRDQASKEKANRQADAASRARLIWEKLPDSGKSPYLDKKKVRGFGVRYSRGAIVVPVRNSGGDLVGLQFIDPEGSKKFLTGTAKQGAYHLIHNEQGAVGDTLWIAEGYATGATVRMATGQAVAVAFDAGNLLPVAQALKAIYPLAAIAFAADNDTKKEQNTGLLKAWEAASLLDARVALPDFSNVNAA